MQFSALFICHLPGVCTPGKSQVKSEAYELPAVKDIEMQRCGAYEINKIGKANHQRTFNMEDNPVYGIHQGHQQL